MDAAGGGTRLETAAPPWLEAMSARLTTRRVGTALRYLASIASTNDVARDWLDREGPDGLVVVAGRQTEGRGRRGRSWASPPGHGLYVSIGLRPALPADRATWLTFLGAVAAAQGLRRQGVPVEIRWPNDLEVGGRKLGGILVETRLEGAAIPSAIVGIGINLGQSSEDFPAELAGAATSIRQVLGSPPDAGAVLESILARLDEWYDALGSSADLAAAGRHLLDCWAELAPGHRGARVAVDREDGPLHGVTDGLEVDGALRVRDADGRLVVVRLGDLRRLRETGKETG